MQPDDLTRIEAKLRSRLMPVALSESATSSIHAMLDELTGIESFPADAVIGSGKRELLNHFPEANENAGSGVSMSAEAHEKANESSARSHSHGGHRRAATGVPCRARHGAAAAVAGLLAVSAWFASPAIEEIAFSASSVQEPAVEEPGQTMHLVDESTHLAWVEDEGWLADPDGGALRAVRMRVVEENRLLDEETGLIVHIASPREEMLLTPVSTF